MLYHLQIIGEAACTLSSELTQNYSQIPWSKIIGLRNRVVHEYFAIDLDIVIDIVIYDLPDLREQIQGILNDFSDS
ncbi:HepT-like ribonuclease domain-containing protein [Spirulina sp. CS-785/01]|uniref:HepT-like ribonuclease domain-containing protein n=1 Tax=Spirulina sp. CS-785/01 TaxID=3021716 RepID=UPI003FA7B888